MSAEERDNIIDTANPGELTDSSSQPAPPDLDLLDQALAPIPSPNDDPPKPVVPAPFPSPNHLQPSQHNDFEDDPSDDLATNPPPPPSRPSNSINQSPPSPATTGPNQPPVALDSARSQNVTPSPLTPVEAHQTSIADEWKLTAEPTQQPVKQDTSAASVPRPLPSPPPPPPAAVPSSPSSEKERTPEVPQLSSDAPTDTATSHSANDYVNSPTPQPVIYDEPDKLMGATAVVQAMRIIAVGDTQDSGEPLALKRTSSSQLEQKPDDEDGPDTPRLPRKRERAVFDAHPVPDVPLPESPDPTAAVPPLEAHATIRDIIPEADHYEPIDPDTHHDDEELEPEEVIAEAPVTQTAETPSLSASAPPPPVRAVSPSHPALEDAASEELLELDVEPPHAHHDEVSPPPPPPAIADASPATAPEPSAPIEQSSEKPSTKPTPKKSPRKGRQGWEIAFADEFVRAYPKLKPRQLDTEVSFIERSLGIQQGGVLLDLGCGFGQHAVELASRGYNVVGYDLSLTMLAMASDEAHERGQKINFLHGDMRDMAFEQLFDGVYCWSTSFGFFDEETNISVIRRVHRALRQGGMFLLDIINRDYVCTRLPTLVWFEGDGCVCIDDAQFNSFTSRIRVKRTIMTDDGMSREVEYTVRLYSLHEIGKILHEAGFKVVEVSGHPASAGAFFDSESPRVITLAVRR